MKSKYVLISIVMSSSLWMLGSTGILQQAVRLQDKDMIRKAVKQQGVLVDSYDVSGETALMKAAYFNLVDMAQVLLDLGAQINYTNAQDGKTPLMIAVEEGNIDMVKFLLRHPKIDLSMRDRVGYNVLDRINQKISENKLNLEYTEKDPQYKAKYEEGIIKKLDTYLVIRDLLSQKAK